MRRMEQSCLVRLVQENVLLQASQEGIEIDSVPLVVVLELAKQAVATTMEGGSNGPSVMRVV